MQVFTFLIFFTRFVPDDVSFDDEDLVDQADASEIGETNFEPSKFFCNALCSTEVGELSYDTDLDKKRSKLVRRMAASENVSKNELKAILDLSDDPADNNEQLEEGHMVDCDQKSDNDDSHNVNFSDFKAKLNVPSSESESSGEDLEFDWNCNLINSLTSTSAKFSIKILQPGKLMLNGFTRR